MADKRIEVLIRPDGSVTMEGQGFSGPECERATEALEAALGTTVDDQRSSEYWIDEKQRADQ